MEDVWRQKTPAFMRSLLLDISLKEDEPCGADTTLSGKEDCLSSSSPLLRPCGLCLSNPAQYTCPRCNVFYCSLSCYRGSSHALCSEQFYKECVFQELRQRGRAEPEDRNYMKDILLRMRQAEGGLDRVLRELKENSCATEKDTETVTLLSRLAEIQTDGEEGHEDELQDILQRLEQEGDNEEEENVVKRLSGLNIESLSRDELWMFLPEKDKKRFQQLLKDGGIGALVPIWQPWWEEHQQEHTALIEELQREGCAEERRHSEERDVRDVAVASEAPLEKVNVNGHREAPPPISNEVQPPVISETPPLSSLCSVTPSPLVMFSLVNVLYGYTFTLRLFNGDVSEQQQVLECARLLLLISECLACRRTFGSFSESLNGAMASVSTQHYDSASVLRAVEGMAHILSGASPNQGAGYTLSALSHLRALFSRARTMAPRSHSHLRRMCFLAGKKCAFLQAWTNENSHTLGELAKQAWSEWHRQSAERRMMERDRKWVEKNRKKEGVQGKVLIEEI